MKKPELIALLTQACVSETGLLVSTNDPNKLRQKLYATRKESPEYASLSFVIPVNGADDTLFIINKQEQPNGES